MSKNLGAWKRVLDEAMVMQRLIQRRMKETGESRDQALSALAKLMLFSVNDTASKPDVSERILGNATEEIVQRRRRKTGESYEEAKGHVDAVTKAVASEVSQDWVENWIRDDRSWTEHWGAEKQKEMHSIPAFLRPMAIRFPPLCVVKARVPLIVPTEGTVGFVNSYHPDADGVHLGVMQQPYSTVEFRCWPDDLEVVGYCHGLTSERLREILEG